MYGFILTIHIIVCVLLVLLVLIQQGKGAEVGAVFGSGEAVFGPSGPASMIGKITTALVVMFFLTSLSLTYLSSKKKQNSIMEEVKVQKNINEEGADAKKEATLNVTNPVINEKTTNSTQK
jgi:preprotein translocase subunit SecG